LKSFLLAWSLEPGQQPGNLKALSFNPFHASVRGLKAEPRRIPRAPNPLLYLLVILVLRISQRREQVVVAGDAAAILLRSGVGSAQTNWMFEVRVRW
jgi:hypothetical protein